MQPSYLPISQVFSQDQRFTVPLFQRPYVWKKEEQWEPLWDDVKGVLERLRRRDGDEVVASHFLGTIVLEQKPTATGCLPRREVIDGQQRLTTLQILLKAVEHAIGSLPEAENDQDLKLIDMAKRQVAKLTLNDAGDEEVYKVWPTNEDRLPFRAVMDANGDGSVSPGDGLMAQAYAFFLGASKEFLASGRPVDTARLLSEAVRNYMRLIVLDLDRGDEPQAIFETLNAHGTPLLPADLIKNWLLWEATRQKQDTAQLYEKHWRHFDSRALYWRANRGAGHAARALVDIFLQNWLSRETVDTVSPKHLYDRFQRHAEGMRAKLGSDFAIDELMARIHVDAQRFSRIDHPTGKSRFDIFLGRLKRLDMLVFHPMLLEVMARTENDPEEADSFGSIMESYLVRRLICGSQTRSYGSLSLAILREIRANKSERVSTVLRKFLMGLKDSDIWPEDNSFKARWMSRQFYGNIRRERVLMILQAIEGWYQARNAKSEPLASFDWSQLQIEHILPRNWEKNWPLPEGVLPEQRDMVIHGIGNLTLVSAKLNPSMSNAAWLDVGSGKSGKRDALKQHSILRMNHELVEGNSEAWDEAAIRNRAEALFKIAVEVWPR